MVSQILIRWIVIYPVDSAIQRLNNRGQFVTLTHAQHECSQHSFGLPSRPFQFFTRVSNPVAFLFKTLMKTLLYMPPDPPRRASLFPGVKPSCRPVQTVVKSLLYMSPDPLWRASLFPGVKPSCRPVQTVVKSLLYMSPDPLWRASLFPGVKPGCRPVQSLNETPVIYAPGPT